MFPEINCAHRAQNNFLNQSGSYGAVCFCWDEVRLYTLLAEIDWTLLGSHIMLTTRLIRDVQPLDAVQHQRPTLIRKSAYIRCVELYYHLWDDGLENSPNGIWGKRSDI